MDADAIGPAAVAKAKAKIPVVAYDRLIQDKDVLYLTFDNVEVGHMRSARGAEGPPQGNYVVHQGLAHRPERRLPQRRQREVLKAAMDKGDIKIVGEQVHRRLGAQNAQKNMEQILTKNANKVDAVVASTTARPAAWWPR